MLGTFSVAVKKCSEVRGETKQHTFEVTSLPGSIVENKADEGMLLLSTFVHLISPGS